jgi:hypothetical protein
MKMPVLPRMWDWWVATVAAAVLVWWLAPAQFQVVAYKISLITLAIMVAYWADKSLFSRASDRIHKKMQRDVYGAARLLTRALVVLAVVLGITLGI